MKKRLISLFILSLLIINCNFVNAEDLNLSGNNYILMDATSGRVIMEKNSNEKLAMASTTKIMTALIALEEGNLEDRITIDDRSINIEGSSIYLKENEVLSLKDLLYGLMLRSGNDSSIAIANHIGKDEDEFVNKMNSKAKSIGANNTNFKNPNGLSEEGHYSTAYDLAVITREALKNKEFKEIFKSKSYDANREKNSHFINKNKTLWEYEGGNGGKTGYTMSSGRCLVSTAQRNGMNLISVSLNASDWFNDNYKLMDYGFENFKPYIIYDSNQLIKTVDIEGGNKTIHALAKNELIYPLSNEERKDIKIKLDIDKGLKPPIERNQKIGVIETYLQGVLIKKTDIISKEKVKRYNVIQNILERIK